MTYRLGSNRAPTFTLSIKKLKERLSGTMSWVIETLLCFAAYLRQSCSPCSLARGLLTLGDISHYTKYT